MVRIGQAPHLECSTAGDRRFSAFCARIRGRGGRSIEDLYQAAKVLPDGRTGLTWRQAKGRRAVNEEEVRALYAQLWREYLAENPGLIPVLLAQTGLSDRFGRPGGVCQATVLWELRAEHLGEDE
jgi:hypothetical protein